MKTESGKRLLIFLAVTYGITIIMSLPMFIGFTLGTDLSVFLSAQMLYPAAGVIIGILAVSHDPDGKRDEMKLPKGFFNIFIVITGILMIISVASVIMPVTDMELSGTKVSIYSLATNYTIMMGSIASIISIIASGKDKRAAAGLTRKNWGISIWMVILFMLLYFGRTVAATLIQGLSDGNGIIYLTDWLKVFEEQKTWGAIAVLPINYFLVFIVFFGEEYGWRYYLQPVMQKKFGKRGGVLLLGICWGLWHVAADLMYYSSTNGIQMVVMQMITCTALGIFFAYAYMKTGNIWVPVALHYLNNNLVPIVSGNYSMDVLQNQIYRWEDVLVNLGLAAVFFGLFLFARPFGKNRVSAESE